MSAVEQYYERNTNRAGHPQIHVNWPQDISVSIEDRSPTSSLRVALIRIDDVTIRHQVEDARLLIAALGEMLDDAVRIDDERYAKRGEA